MAAWNRWGGNAWGAGWNNWGAGWGYWAGPVFWPFFFGDVLSFALWPYGLYDPFLAYGPDFLLASIFWPGPSLWPYYAYDGGAGLFDIYGSAPYVENYAAYGWEPLAPSPSSALCGPLRGGSRSRDRARRRSDLRRAGAGRREPADRPDRPGDPADRRADPGVERPRNRGGAGRQNPSVVVPG